MSAPHPPTRVPRSLALYLAAAASGAAALVYEMLWIRRLGEVLGSTAYAIQLVLAIFFGGMGLGAWLGGRLADRLRGRIAYYIVLELWKAACGFAFWPGVEAAEVLCSALAPGEWAAGRTLVAKALLAALVLAPPTLAMGASLPALVRHAVRERSQLSASLAGIYGFNTLGAACGVLLAMFWWIPDYGLRASGVGAALLNVLACVCAFAGRGQRAIDPPTTPKPARELGGRSILWGAALLSGFVSVGLEVLWTRALAARFLSTVYSFATILFVFLLCLGSGALFLRGLEKRDLVNRKAAACVMTLAGLGGLFSVALLTRMQPVDIEAFAGRGWGALQRRELWQALAVMVVPVWLFGLNFPLLARLLHRELDSVGGELGGLYFINTLGSLAAPLVLTFGVLPVVGLKWTLLACGASAVLYGVCVLVPWAGIKGGQRATWAAVSTLLGLGAVVSVGGEVRLWREAPGDELLHYEDGPAASVAVVQTSDGNRLLKIDNHYRLGATRNWFAQERQALVPIVLMGEPRTVLAIGMATGSSAGAAAAFGGIEVDILEIVPGLGQLLPFFGDSNLNLATRLRSDPAVRLLEVDARQFIRSTDRTYDLVLGDLFIPWRAGEGAMYTLEHFRAVQSVLRPGGVFCQWLPLYQLRPADLRIIARTFCEVFPNVEMYWLYFNAQQPAACLLGSLATSSATPLDRRALSDARRTLLTRTGLMAPAELHGSRITGGDRLRAWCANAPLETQDRPRIEFGAPSHRFESARPPAAESVAELLELMEHELASAGPGARTPELAYGNAIAHFFRAEELRLYAGDPAGAVRQLRAALAAVPDWAWIAWNLEQIVRAHAPGPQRAIALEAAGVLAQAPSFAAQGLYLTASVHLQAGDRSAAKLTVERALAIDPEHPASLQLLDQLGD